jgi:hypothetical protein
VVIAALVAITAAAAGFHELPNLFQLGSTLVVGLLAALATWELQKNPHFRAFRVLTKRSLP